MKDDFNCYTAARIRAFLSRNCHKTRILNWQLTQLLLVMEVMTDLKFLHCPKNTPLRRLSGHFGQGNQSERILKTLENENIYTYQQLLEYSKDNDFSSLPGIGAHIAERIRRFIEFIENRNKAAVVNLFLEMNQRFPNMRSVAEQLIKERHTHNDLLHNYT